MRLKTLVFLVLTLSGCASQSSLLRTPVAGISARGVHLVSDTLYFGTQKPHGTVGRGEWEAFLKEEVTPRFPEGLTTWEAKGQWRDKKGKIIGEKSRVLLLVHPDGVGADLDVREIIEAYKKRFQQESVLRVKGRAEVSF